VQKWRRPVCGPGEEDVRIILDAIQPQAAQQLARTLRCIAPEE
jgi:hypothetical protein